MLNSENCFAVNIPVGPLGFAQLALPAGKSAREGGMIIAVGSLVISTKEETLGSLNYM